MNLFQKLEEKYLFSPKLIYLIVNLHFYGFHQLRFAFARDKFMINEEDYGKFTGCSQFLTFFTSILIGNLSDRTRKYKPIFMALIIISTAVFLHFYLSPLTDISPAVFWVLMFLYLATNNPKQPLLDKIMIDYLDFFTTAGAKLYGRQRLWGTVSLSLATYLCEWCIKDKDGSFNFNYLIHYNVLAMMAAFACVGLLLKTKENTAVQQETTERVAPVQQRPVHSKASFIELFKNAEFMFFIFIIFSNAITRSALTIYLNIFHKDILQIKPYSLPSGWPTGFKNIVGFFNSMPISTLTTFGIIFEMAVMLVADKIIDRLGYFWPLIIAQVVSTIRFLAYYFISPENKHVYGLSCLFELLRGIYFGMIHISSVHIAPRLAPPHLKATSQIMYSGTFAAVGSLLSGYIFGDMFKNRITGTSSLSEREAIYKQIFLINSVISLATVALCVVKYGMIDKVLTSRDKENQKLSRYEVEAMPLSSK